MNLRTLELEKNYYWLIGENHEKSTLIDKF